MQTGALLQIWHSTDQSDLFSNGGHSQVFRSYTYDGDGNINGIDVTDNSGGIEHLNRANYTNETILGVNLKDN